MTPAKRLFVIMAGNEDASATWSESDNLAGFDIHPSGALLIYVDGEIHEPARLAMVHSFGTWLAVQVDGEPRTNA